ncbi:sulfurtransferase complex subunit TusD [uncultured Psychrobacter sp.]|uniref:sulfurtransferase complex subunit TusD n=1 Tax=uncultured Psychrobacter sp. TaxID=259303 RepID=UPI00345AFBD9
MSQTLLLLITKDPSHPLAHLALRYARTFLEAKLKVNATDRKNETDDSENDNQLLKLFFYADAANIANRLRWQSADQVNLTKEWQILAEQYQLALPVCVSTALSRGISDPDNSARHQLQGDNLAESFELVGLSELALMMQSDCRVLQF